MTRSGIKTAVPVATGSGGKSDAQDRDLSYAKVRRWSMDYAYQKEVRPPSAKLVLLTMAYHADRNGETWVSAGRVAAMCNMPVSTVRRLRSDLVKEGHLTKHYRHGRIIWQIVGVERDINRDMCSPLNAERSRVNAERSPVNATPFTGEHITYNDHTNDQSSNMARSGAPVGAPSYDYYDENDEIPF